MSYPPVAFYPWKKLFWMSPSHPLYLSSFAIWLLRLLVCWELYGPFVYYIVYTWPVLGKQKGEEEGSCLYPTNNSAKTSSYPEKKGFATIDVRTLWTVVVHLFLNAEKQNETWKASKKKKKKWKGRRSNWKWKFLFFTFPPGFFFLLFNVGHVYWLTFARQRKRKKNLLNYMRPGPHSIREEVWPLCTTLTFSARREI